MQTLTDWRNAKQLQAAYEEFRTSDAGEAEDQTLLSMMMDGVPEVAHGDQILHIEAMSAAFMKGYHQCWKNRHALRPHNFKSVEPEKKELSPGGMPVDPVRLQKIKDSLPTQ